MNITREEARRSAKIAGISDAAKEQLRATPLANNQSVLLRIAKEATPEAQIAKVVAELSRKPPRQPRSPGDERKFEQVKIAWENSTELLEAWEHLAKPDRERFFEVMRGHSYSA